MAVMPWKKQADPASLDWIQREPERTYHERRAKYLSSHLLAEYRKSGAYTFRAKQTCKIPDIDRPAFLFGRASHCLILEGDDAFLSRFQVGGEPINEKTGKPYGPETHKVAEWLAELGKDYLSASLGETLWSMYGAVKAHPVASALLSSGVPEGVARADYIGEPSQIRMDWFNPDHGIVDLKTCDQMDFFESDARRYGYIYQMAFYRSVAACASGREFPVHMIAVEKKAPFRCGVWAMDPLVLSAAADKNEECIRGIQECRISNIWPTGYETVRSFTWI
jgi:hypothetical protein